MRLSLMTTDLAGLAKKLDALQKDLTGAALKNALTKVGMEGKALTATAVKGDLGDLSFSNWRRGRPIPIGVRFNVLSDTAVEFVPTPRSNGPMRVLEDGRRAGVSKGRKRKGRVGATAGRGTWSDATKKMETELPKVVQDHVRTVLRKTFGG